MLFNSFEFIFLFFPLTFFIYWNLSVKHDKGIMSLTIFSYVFYGIWDYRFTFLMLFCTLLNYYCGKYISSAKDIKTKKIWLIVAIVFSIVIIGYFKYLNFFSSSINYILIFLQFETLIPVFNFILPVGISFFTFQALSYTIDVYREQINPCKNLITFMCFVSFFPQLIAGPIVRFSEIEKQLVNLKSELNTNDSFIGIIFLVSGFFKKLIIADQIALIIDPYWIDYDGIGFIGSWFIAIGYTYQIYFDFSGYSDMAVGLGRLFGINLPRNFNLPYTASNISDFWKRWHITLSRWLKDYLYIGLGGSHNSLPNTLRNLMITMGLGGLWHGANWTFVLWGIYHGALLIIFHLFKVSSVFKIQSNRTSNFITFISVIFGWVLFRSESIDKAFHLIVSMIGLNGFGIEFLLSFKLLINFLMLIFLSIFLSHFYIDTWDIEWKPSKKLIVITSTIIIICILMINRGSEFLYYQF